MTALTSPTSSRRGARSAVRTAESGRLHTQAAALVRSRWPGLDANDIAHRVVLRLQHERNAGYRHDDLSIWLRSAVYELVVRDQRADRGDDRHYEELTVLLQELATPARGRIRTDLVRRALHHIHPRDVVMLRLKLLGHSDTAVAERLGVRIVEVDRAYDRGRARLRATIDSDGELRDALGQAARGVRLARYSARRPRQRRPVRDSTATVVHAPVGAA